MHPYDKQRYMRDARAVVRKVVSKLALTINHDRSHLATALAQNGSAQYHPSSSQPLPIFNPQDSQFHSPDTHPNHLVNTLTSKIALTQSVRNLRIPSLTRQALPETPPKPAMLYHPHIKQS
jgi:hypothetical protein